LAIDAQSPHGTGRLHPGTAKTKPKYRDRKFLPKAYGIHSAPLAFLAKTHHRFNAGGSVCCLRCLGGVVRDAGMILGLWESTSGMCCYNSMSVQKELLRVPVKNAKTEKKIFG